jgi:hypothetical protein
VTILLRIIILVLTESFLFNTITSVFSFEVFRSWKIKFNIDKFDRKFWLTTLFTSISNLIASHKRMVVNNELGSTWEEEVMAQFEALFRNFSAGD